MKSYSRTIDPGIARAKPLLGTTVALRVHGLEPARAHAAIDAGFAAVRGIHEAMSFHNGDSEVCRLNRDAHKGPVAVGDKTYTVIAHAQAISAIAEGAFDITIAPRLVARGHVPRPAHAPDPDGRATWRDIELLPENRIRFRRPLWIDLGGIAKGYAVDCAMEALLASSPAQASVNAGGDLRVAGPSREYVRLAAGHGAADTVPVMDLANGSLASSERRARGTHIDPRRAGAETQRFVSVAAPRCIDADALTKVVMARGASAGRSLAARSAQAVMHDAEFGWREIGGQA